MIKAEEIALEIAQGLGNGKLLKLGTELQV